MPPARRGGERRAAIHEPRRPSGRNRGVHRSCRAVGLVGNSLGGGWSSRRSPWALLEGLDRQVELGEFGVAPAAAEYGAVPLGAGGAAGLQVLFGGLEAVLRGDRGVDGGGQRGREVNLLLGAGCQQLAGRVGDRAPVRWRLRGVCHARYTSCHRARSRPACAAGSGRCAPRFTWRGARSGVEVRRTALPAAYPIVAGLVITGGSARWGLPHLAVGLPRCWTAVGQVDACFPWLKGSLLG
jgi:hypothetical protein